MKFLLALMTLVACSVLASDASAQGGSVGSKASVRYRTVLTPRTVTDYVPRTRLVWEPRTVAVASYGSNGGRSAAGYGSNGGTAFGRARAFTARVGQLAWRPIARVAYGSTGR